MSAQPDPQPHAEPRAHAAPTAPTPRADLFGACGWIALGIAVLAGAISMDRLERQNINPYTVPGLLPGLLGIALIALGGALALRSWRRGGTRQATGAPAADLRSDLRDEQRHQRDHQRDERRRIAIVIALCVGYGAVLIGHGLPFWLASTIYVTVSILILQRLSRDPEQKRLSPTAIAKALVIGVCASFITQWVFQDLFLVRLP